MYIQSFYFHFWLQTNVGDILIAVNPFKELQIYDKKVKLFFFRHIISNGPMRNGRTFCLILIHNVIELKWVSRFYWSIKSFNSNQSLTIHIFSQHLICFLFENLFCFPCMSYIDVKKNSKFRDYTYEGCS